LPEDFIQKEGDHAFIDGVKDRLLKKHLLVSGDRSLSKALNQVFKLDAVKMTAGTPVRLQEVIIVCVGTPVISEENIGRGETRRSSIIKTGVNVVEQEQQPNGALVSSSSSLRFILGALVERGGNSLMTRGWT
jgi:hypothetical protein